MIACSKDREETGASLDLTLAYLINVVGLDRQRLRLTSTEKARLLFPVLARYGVKESQIRFVDWQEARQKGEGSGYFEPKGHPRSPSFDTVSIEYIFTDGSELEIAEIGILAWQGFGVGVERVTMARQNKVMRWDDSLPGFWRAVEQVVHGVKAAHCLRGTTKSWASPGPPDGLNPVGLCILIFHLCNDGQSLVAVVGVNQTLQGGADVGCGHD